MLFLGIISWEGTSWGTLFLMEGSFNNDCRMGGAPPPLPLASPLWETLIPSAKINCYKNFFD